MVLYAFIAFGIKPQTPNPKPQTPNPTPQTHISKTDFETFSPKHSTFNLNIGGFSGTVASTKGDGTRMTTGRLDAGQVYAGQKGVGAPI